MKAYKLFIALAFIGVLGFTSCRDEFTDLNQNPTAVSTAEPSYLATKCMTDFNIYDYLYWFYNQPIYAKLTQMGASGTFSEGSYSLANLWGQNPYINCLTYRNDINQFIENNNRPELKAYSAMCGVLAVYGAIFSSDINGDIQYSQASMYRYGGPLTPDFDRVEDLYNNLLTELDGYIATFQDDTQVVTAKQDIIYNGNMAKWAKLANSLKLKIAVRLYNSNPEKAKSIAKEVTSSAVGYVDSMEDAFIYHKADADTGGDLAYQTGNGLSGWIASASWNVVTFMRNSLDPRVRFFYTKNSWNSEVVKAFIEANGYDQLPGFIKEAAVFDADNNFVSWGRLGNAEPFVRYTGYPIVFDGSDEYKALKGEYFETLERYNVKIGDKNKSYGLYSGYNEEMMRGRCSYTVPTIPGGPVITDTEQVPWWGMYLGSGEINLYLAELAQLGATLPKSAKDYYERGVELSVKEWDFIAGKNKIPYYGKTYDYDPNEVSIELKEGEIAAMLATDAVKWDGSIEKIYLQELMNFTLMPDEAFVTARRSGYPKIGSTLLPYVKFREVELTAIPRRAEFGEPSPTDIMHDIRMASLNAQGFTAGTGQSGTGFSANSVLNTERLWQDKNAPQWGSAK